MLRFLCQLARKVLPERRKAVKATKAKTMGWLGRLLKLEEKWHPNHVTLIRLPIAVLVILGLLLGQQWYGVSFGLFIAFGCLDSVDGQLAKLFNKKSRDGSKLDELVDKLGVLPVYALLSLENKVLACFFVIILFRDLWSNTLRRLDCKGDATGAGKVKTVILIILGAAIMLGDVLTYGSVEFEAVDPIFDYRFWFLAAAATTSFVTGVIYTKGSWPKLKARSKTWFELRPTKQ